MSDNCPSFDSVIQCCALFQPLTSRIHTICEMSETRLFSFQGTKKRAPCKMNGHNYPLAIQLVKSSLNPIIGIELFHNHTHIGLMTSIHMVLRHFLSLCHDYMTARSRCQVKIPCSPLFEKCDFRVRDNTINHFIRRERGKSSIWLCKTYLRVLEERFLQKLHSLQSSVDRRRYYYSITCT